MLLEGNVHFPPGSRRPALPDPSRAKSLCPWKGIASYYTLEADRLVRRNATRYYPHPVPLAQRIKEHVAFLPTVLVDELT